MEDVKEPCEDSKKDVPNSSTSSSKELSMTLPEDAFNNFLQGKRHMLVQDYSFAVQSLATACEMYVTHYGELAIECGEVYFLYGKALFRLSQQQAGVLGDALNDGSNEDENSSESESKENEENESDKNSDAEEGEENADAEEGEENADAEGEENADAEGDKDEKEPSESTDSPPAVLDEASSEAKTKDEASKSDEAGPSQQEKSVESSSGGQPSEGSKLEEGTDQEPEEDDLELAWNTLETAKSIFKRQNTIESELKVAEILQLLAEISMESDNNPAAIIDLEESLKIQKKYLKPDDRILAETYYQMGLAQMLEKKYPQALENFRTTKQILELRRENLRNTKVDDADGTFKSADIQAEISDLDTILVDIQEKIEDTLELITNKEKEKKESLIDEAGSSSISMKDMGEKSTVNKPVSNITHLLKRKKPDDGVSEDGAKRIKTTNLPNGESNVTESETKIAEG